MMRKLTGALLAVGLSALVAACGGGSSGGGSGSGGGTAKLQPAQYGQAVNLRAGDVPGFQGTPYHADPGSRRLESEFAACAGAVGPSRQLAEVHSPDFKRGSGLTTQQVSSSVTVMPSVSVVQRDLSAIRSARGKACLKTYLDRLLSKQANGAVKFGTSTIARIPVPQSGEAGFGYRVKVPASAAGASFAFYADLLGFPSGRAEISLMTLSIEQPFPSGVENRLYTLLVNRAQRQRV